MLNCFRHSFILLAVVFVCGSNIRQVTADEWNRFRGPNGSGVSDAKTVPVEWRKDDYNFLAEATHRRSPGVIAFL